MKALLLTALLSIGAKSVASAQTGMTADELLNHANAHFSAGRYAEAADAYRQFVIDYGNADEARNAVSRLRFPLAWSLIQARQFADALDAIRECLDKTMDLGPQEREELMFWKGVCELQSDEPDPARASFETFVSTFPRSSKAPEATLLAGATFLVQERFEEAALYFQSARESLAEPYRGRAFVRELNARIQARQLEEAVALLKSEADRFEDVAELMTLQLLAMDLGSQCLESQMPRKALFCFQQIWTAERLIARQMKQIEEAQAALNRRKNATPFEKFVLSRTVTETQAELDRFRKIPRFDIALRLRLANAYQAMRRFREAAIVLDELLRSPDGGPEVESATSAAVYCWTQCERWPKAIEAAQQFARRFPRSTELPQVLYLQGVAEQQSDLLDDAQKTFDSITRNFPKSDFAARARFMKGFTDLLADHPGDAVHAFDEFLRNHPTHELADAATYWRGVGFSLSGEYDRCREAMDTYLNRFPQGAYGASAVFRKAYAAHAKRDFATSIAENTTYLKDFPGHGENAEALILLGDAFMNEGEIEKGIAAFARIPQEDVRFYEEGVFKTVKALRLLERFDQIIAHLERFKETHPSSPRIAEAIFHIGRVYRERDEIEKARHVYWQAIRQLGDDDAIRSIEDLFPALAKLYAGPEDQAVYLKQLEDLQADALRTGRKVLATRSLWAQGLALKKKDPAGSRNLFAQAAEEINPQTSHPLVLADLAEALIAAGDQTKGRMLFRELLRWNPRASQKDRALLALATIAQRENKPDEALERLNRLSEETPDSPLLGKALLLKANLEEKAGAVEKLQSTLETLLAAKFVSGQYKAEALCRLADRWMKAGKADKAFAYYQRIYVLYGRWSPWVAKAYLHSGKILEARKDFDAARKTYEEMTSREELADFAEYKEAHSRLQTLNAG